MFVKVEFVDGRGGRVHYSIKRDSKDNPAGYVPGIHSPRFYYSLENMEFSVLHNFVFLFSK